MSLTNNMICKPRDIKTRVMPAVNNRALKHAFITVPVTSLGRLLQYNRIQVGCSRCRMEEIISPNQCFKCLCIGHKAAQCINKEENGKLCFICRQNDHIVKDSKNAPICPKCVIEGHRMDSTLCPAYA